MDILDFRSDTITQPTPEMREAMANAKVGDDVYGEDPTVNKLQEISAEKMGMEAGLFVPSGTMGNLSAVLAHCTRGDEVILGGQAHIFINEAGGMSALGGVHSYQIPNQPDGSLALDDIRDAIRGPDAHHPITRLVSIENTQNRCGGVSLSVEYTRAVADLAHQQGLMFHIDGARIFNAAADQGVIAKDLSEPADSITFCLSKGLSAPVGSVVCGSKEYIARVHRIRKQLGGGMRQVGILAAAGIVALESLTERLADDHRRARQLAEGLANIPGIEFEVQNTNMAYFGISKDAPLSKDEFLKAIKGRGLLVGNAGVNRCRMVTHYWIDDHAVAKALEIIAEVVAG